MKNALVIVVTLLVSAGFCFADSIILPFWQNDANVYTLFCILNTSTSTDNLIQVMFYGETGNTQAGSHIERTIPAQHLEIFGTGTWDGTPKMMTGDLYGYAIASETGGMLAAIGLVYDRLASAGYPINCWKGTAANEADPGW